MLTIPEDQLLSLDQIDLYQGTKAHDLPWTGGAVVKGKKFGYAMAELSACNGSIILRLASEEEFEFTPNQVRGLEIVKCAGFGLHDAAGIQIHHRLKDYPEQIIFLFLCDDPQPFLAKLQEFGF